MNEEDDISAEERAQAARLAESLEQDPTAELIRAAAGRAAPLGEVRARGLARAAVEEAVRPRASRRRRWTLLTAVAVAVVVLLIVGVRRDPVPERLLARSAAGLVPGPFPPSQTAADRLDLVTSDRLIAYREARARRVARGER